MKKLLLVATWLILLSLIIGAIGCGGEEATPTPTKQPTATPTITPTPTPEPIVLKLSHGYTENSINGQTAIKIKELTEQYTDGRVQVELFHNATLFTEMEQVQAASTGMVDIIQAQDWVLQYAGQMDWLITYLPFWWDGWEHYRPFIEHPDGGVKMRKNMEEVLNVKALATSPSCIWSLVITNSKELESFYDLDGIKMRSVSGIMGVVYEQVGGATMLTMNTAEAFTAYEMGTLDAMATATGSAVSMKSYETSEYAFLMRAMTASGNTICMNMDKWNSLPSDIQDIFTSKIMPDLVDWAFEFTTQEELSYLDILRKNMTTHTITDEERIKVREELWPLADKYLSMIDPDLLALAESLRP
ncbi:TRAP transporter substrate-binding protein [Chloroflexota bacterium]